MTDAANATGFNLRAEIARLDRDRAETQKLSEETRKYVAEAHKLDAEARKLDREYRWFPWLQLGAHNHRRHRCDSALSWRICDEVHGALAAGKYRNPWPPTGHGAPMTEEPLAFCLLAGQSHL